MNSDKIGNFIKKLRLEKGLTQEDLANKVFVGKGAVSKWERGKTLPEISVLKELSNLFDVTINEILAGEKDAKNIDVTLELYEDRNRIKKNVKYFILIIALLLLLFFGYYFFNQYKSINVYSINGFGKNFEVRDGLFVKTNEKMYFSLGNITSINQYSIKTLQLYYVNDNNKVIIYSTQDSNVAFFDKKGYEEYFDLANLNTIIDNMFLEIMYNEDVETLKLNFIEDYVNDNLIFSEKEKISENINDLVKTDSLLLEKMIKNKFDKVDDYYFYNSVVEEKLVNYIFIEDSDMLHIEVVKNNKIVEEFFWDLKYLSLTYNNNVLNFSILYDNDKYNCIQGNCRDEKEIFEKFNKVFLDELY